MSRRGRNTPLKNTVACGRQEVDRIRVWQERARVLMLRDVAGGTYDRARFEVVARVVIELKHEDHDQVIVALRVPSNCIHKPAHASN